MAKRRQPKYGVPDKENPEWTAAEMRAAKSARHVFPRAFAESTHRRRLPAERRARISFSAYNAEHIYDWLRMYWKDDDQKFGGCPECEVLGRRLEKFIGPKSVRFVERGLRRAKRRAQSKAAR